MNFLLALSGIAFVAGWIWAIVVAFRSSGAFWGVLNLLPFQPLIAIISAAMKKTAWLPVGLMIIGLILFYFAGGMATIYV